MLSGREPWRFAVSVVSEQCIMLVARSCGLWREDCIVGGQSGGERLFRQVEMGRPECQSFYLMRGLRVLFEGRGLAEGVEDRPRLTAVVQHAFFYINYIFHHKIDKLNLKK